MRDLPIRWKVVDVNGGYIVDKNNNINNIIKFWNKLPCDAGLFYQPNIFLNKPGHAAPRFHYNRLVQLDGWEKSWLDEPFSPTRPQLWRIERVQLIASESIWYLHCYRVGGPSGNMIQWMLFVRVLWARWYSVMKSKTNDESRIQCELSKK